MEGLTWEVRVLELLEARGETDDKDTCDAYINQTLRNGERVEDVLRDYCVNPKNCSDDGCELYKMIQALK